MNPARLGGIGRLRVPGAAGDGGVHPPFWRGLLAQRDGEEMGGWDHGGGFSLEASVRIAGADRVGRERLLRYCARPPFALDHLHQHDAEHLVYHLPKPRPDGPRAPARGPPL